MKEIEQKAQQYFEKFAMKPEVMRMYKSAFIAFAAYCLEQEPQVPASHSELNTFLLVNFLRLPEEHQKSLADSMKERRPDLFGEPPNNDDCQCLEEDRMHFANDEDDECTYCGKKFFI